MFHGSHTSLPIASHGLEGGAGCDEPTGLSPPPSQAAGIVYCRETVRSAFACAVLAVLAHGSSSGLDGASTSSRQHADDDERSSSCSRALVLFCPVHGSYAWIRWDHRWLIAGLQRQLPGRQLFICIAM